MDAARQGQSCLAVPNFRDLDRFECANPTGLVSLCDPLPAQLVGHLRSGDEITERHGPVSVLVGDAGALILAFFAAIKHDRLRAEIKALNRRIGLVRAENVRLRPLAERGQRWIDSQAKASAASAAKRRVA